MNKNVQKDQFLENKSGPQHDKKLQQTNNSDGNELLQRSVIDNVMTTMLPEEQSTQSIEGTESSSRDNRSPVHIIDYDDDDNVDWGDPFPLGETAFDSDGHHQDLLTNEEFISVLCNMQMEDNNDSSDFVNECLYVAHDIRMDHINVENTVPTDNNIESMQQSSTYSLQMTELPPFELTDLDLGDEGQVDVIQLEAGDMDSIFDAFDQGNYIGINERSNLSSKFFCVNDEKKSDTDEQWNLNSLDLRDIPHEQEDVLNLLDQLDNLHLNEPLDSGAYPPYDLLAPTYELQLPEYEYCQPCSTIVEQLLDNDQQNTISTIENFNIVPPTIQSENNIINEHLERNEQDVSVEHTITSVGTGKELLDAMSNLRISQTNDTKNGEDDEEDLLQFLDNFPDSDEALRVLEELGLLNEDLPENSFEDVQQLLCLPCSTPPDSTQEQNGSVATQLVTNENVNYPNVDGGALRRRPDYLGIGSDDDNDDENVYYRKTISTQLPSTTSAETDVNKMASHSKRQPAVPRDKEDKLLIQRAAPLLLGFGASLHSLLRPVLVEEDNGDKCISTFTGSDTKTPYRSFIGHRERILGCDFSECGKFFATASQDSTVRIWDTSNNSCLSTIQLDPKHEGLRVAWACQTWAQYRLRRSSKDKNTTTGSKDVVRSPYAYLLATGGADGKVHVHGSSHPGRDDWTCYAILDHATYSHFDPHLANDPDDKPQIYSLQFIKHWDAFPTSDNDTTSTTNDIDPNNDDTNSFLLTSSDDHIHLWEIDDLKKTKCTDGTGAKQFHLREVFSLRFSNWHDQHGYGVILCQVTEHGIFKSKEEDCEIGGTLSDANIANKSYFGGDRNPHKLIFVFDARYCSANGLLGAALSDGTLRLINGRGVCLSVLHLPGNNAHLTSFGWDSSGQRLATCVASGHLILWRIEQNKFHNLSREDLRTKCCAVLSGGHAVGKPLFGVTYVRMCDDNNEDEQFLISWGVDGRLCLWDSYAQDEVHVPLSVLVDDMTYPIYAVSTSRQRIVDQESHSLSSAAVVGQGKGTIAVAGGEDGSKGGIPVYIYDILPLENNNMNNVAVFDEAKNNDSTKEDLQNIDC